MTGRKRSLRQLRDILFGTKSHELLVFCFFLAVSFGFWMLQALNETLEREVQVRLSLDAVPSDVVIIDSLPSSISVTLHGRGLTLARHSISSIFRPNRISLDFSKYQTSQNEAEVYVSTAEIGRLFHRRLASSIKIQAVRPDTLRFSYNHGLSKTLPVRLAGTLKPSAQNYIQGISLNPDSVKVFAPKAILDTMHAVYSDAFLLENLHRTGTYPIALREQKLLKYDPQTINLTVNVGYYTEKTVKVPVIGLNFPADKKFRAFPQTVSVTFRVESGRFGQVGSDDFVLATTYEELLENTESSKLRLHMKAVPDGVSNVRISPAEIDYLIEQVAETDSGE